MKIITIYNNDLLEPLLDKMAKLTTEGFGDSVELWRKRFAYWWKDNPYLTDDMPACWIISNDEMDEIFGFHASIPILFQHGDKKLLAAGSGTFYVTPSARGALSTALGIQPSRHKYVDVMISTTANALSHKMICSMGYRRVGNMDTITNYMIIVCCRDFLSMISYLANHFMISETGMRKKLLSIMQASCNAISRVIPKRKIKSVPALTSSTTHYLRICPDSSAFMQYLPLHKKGDTIELSKDKTTLDWILFSPEVQALLHRTTAQIFTKAGEYCGYFIYDIQHVGKDTTLRIRELQLLKPEDAVIKLILKHVKVEAKNAGCAAVYSGLQNPDPAVDKLLHKHILLSLKTDNRYYVKFRKNVITDVDPYTIYVPSDLDPDVGFI